MIVKTVTGAGYGDEGKGLATDFFCRKLGTEKVLNIKVNGGAQAGHTVCALDKEEYKHWVFRQYGSGTFAGADTYLLNTFMVNIDELLKERQALKEIYNINTKLFIDRRCRVTLPIDIVLNRFIEDKRTARHGSCGLGIYETFHRNNDYKSFTIKDMIHYFCTLSLTEFENYINQIDNDYCNMRYIELEKDNMQITAEEKLSIWKKIQPMNKRFIEAIAELAKTNDIIFCNNLDELIEKYKYTALVCECSQGLELDQFEERNWPHLTPSSTGLMNINNYVLNNKYLKECDLETCFITRSYKTKHGAGIFVEEDGQVKAQFGLYDRTNHPNDYQGVLKYGRLNLGRLKRLIQKQVDLININDFKTSIMITHLDQTNSFILTNNGYVGINEVDNKTFGINNKIYKSYGEKATDILE